jgi:ribonuclease HII
MGRKQGVSYHIGVDENGLGPRLGPMVVTAVLARVAPGAEEALGRPRGRLARRLGDSKRLVAHGNTLLAEAWTRALVARGAGKSVAARRDDEHPLSRRSPAELLAALLLDEPVVLFADCPAEAKAQCCYTGHERPTDDGVIGATLADVDAALDALAGRGIEVVAVRVVVCCVGALNRAAAAGRSRFVEDLHAMERLVLALCELARAETAGAEVTAVCGKVGGYADYGAVFGPLAGRLHAVAEQTRRRSAYRFAGLGTVAFEMDADDRHLLVSLASLVGKYLRELGMARIGAFYRALDPSLPDPSGYHDPVTAAFVRATAPLRGLSGVPDACFERRSAARRQR